MLCGSCCVDLELLATYGVERAGVGLTLGGVVVVVAPEPGCTDGRSKLGVTCGADITVADTAGVAGIAGTAGVVGVAGIAGVAGMAGTTGDATGTATGGVLMIAGGAGATIGGAMAGGGDGAG